MSKEEDRVRLEAEFAQYIAERNGLTIEQALAQVRDGTYARAPKKAKKPGKETVQGGKKPKTLAQRIRKRLGPDDGRKGGSPTVQGGSPSLGRR